MTEYGFKKDNEQYVLVQKLSEPQFSVHFVVDTKKQTYSVSVFDGTEEYLLFNVESSSGTFVSNIRQEVEEQERKMLDACFEYANMRKIIEKHIIDTYNPKTEFPWKEYPTFQTFKASNDKWFALIMTIPAEKIKAGEKELVDVINLKCDPNNLQKTIDNKQIFPAYHMNKKMWLTVVLNKNTDKNNLQKLIDDSYLLVSNK